MTINRGPTEALFELISDLFLSGSSTANKIGLTTGRIQVFGKQIIGKKCSNIQKKLFFWALSGDGLKLAGIAINYFVARNAAIAQNPQNSQKENRKKQTVRIGNGLFIVSN